MSSLSLEEETTAEGEEENDDDDDDDYDNKKVNIEERNNNNIKNNNNNNTNNTSNNTNTNNNNNTNNRRIFVGNLIEYKNVIKTSNDLQFILEEKLQYGQIESIHFIPMKFAFVTFQHESSAVLALQDHQKQKQKQKQQTPKLDIRPAKDRNNNNRNNRDNREQTTSATPPIRNNNKRRRPKDIRIDKSTKICFEYIRNNGRICTRRREGKCCPFSHDIQSYIKTRPNDIQSKLIKKCPLWSNYGYCKYGIMCRFGLQHTNPITGENIIICQDKNNNNTIIKDDNMDTSPNLLLPIQVRTQLRKRKYVFQYYTNEKQKQKQQEEEYQQDQKQKQQQQQDSNCTAAAIDDDASSSSSPKYCYEKVTTSSSPPTSPSKSSPLLSPSLPSSSSTTTTNGKRRTNKVIRKIVDFSSSNNNKIYVAPLTTVGNLPFRRIMKQFGADITCGEMALCESLLKGNNSEWALLKKHPSEDIFGIQLAGSTVDQFTKVAELIETYMNDEDNNNNGVDFVDINLGCPIDLICNKGAGVGLMMRDYQYCCSNNINNNNNNNDNKFYFKGILEGMTNILSCPITIKMRTGWDMNKPFAHEFVPKIIQQQQQQRQSFWISTTGTGISSSPIGAIMIHGRSRLQRYNKLADWDYINKVAAIAASQSDGIASKIPIIGNGDIFSFQDYEEKVLSRSGDDGDGDGGGGGGDGLLSKTAMLGRGALIKPWLPTEIKERRNWDISASERLDILKDFVKFGLEHWGSDQQGVNNTRRYLLEWLSFLHRYIPIGLLEQKQQQQQHQKMNQRLDQNIVVGRSDLETLFLSSDSHDWIKITELLLGPVPEGFQFQPKHKAKG